MTRAARRPPAAGAPRACLALPTGRLELIRIAPKSAPVSNYGWGRGPRGEEGAGSLAAGDAQDVPGAASFSLWELNSQGYLAAELRVDSGPGSVRLPGCFGPRAGAAFAPARPLLVSPSLRRPKPRDLEKSEPLPHTLFARGAAPPQPSRSGFSRARCAREGTWK